MSETISRAVVDSSVVVKLFLVEPLHREAHDLFVRLRPNGPGEVLVPEFFHLECANILWKCVRKGLPASDARAHLRDIAGLPFLLVPERFLAGPALDIALRYDVTAYDAGYVALAGKHDAPLVTADERLVERFRKSPYDVRWLGAVGGR